MYAEFGSKEKLFEAVLGHYRDTKLQERIGYLETPAAGIAEIERRLLFLRAGARARGAGIGCLLCNTAVERAPRNASTRKLTREYVDRLVTSFQNALNNAQNHGRLRQGVDIESEAAFFTNHSLGQLTLIRAKVAPEIVEVAADDALARLRALASE